MNKALPSDNEREAIKLGISQLDSPGLRRLLRHIQQKKPVLLNGAVIQYGRY